MRALRRIGTCVLWAGLLALLGVPQLASAQATRTWVSGVGDDANPCSRTAPCKTFAGAISKTAAGGEINCIDSGGFGSVTITKSMMIDCRGVLAGVLVSGTNGIVVDGTGGGTPIHVILRHLDLDGLGTSLAGIRVQGSNDATVHIEEVTIRGFTDGIDYFPSTSSQLTLVHVLVRDNSGHGVAVTPTGGSTNVAVFDSTFAANALTGFLVNDNASAAVTNSIISGNGTHGAAARATGSYAKLSLDRVTSSGNGTSGVLSSGPGGAVYLSNVLTTNNPYGLYPPIGGASYYSFGNNRSGGNTTGDTTTNTLIPQY